jgi:hypothetical protein
MGRRHRKKEENLFLELVQVIAPLVLIFLFVNPRGSQKAAELMPVILKYGTILGVSIFVTYFLYFRYAKKTKIYAGRGLNTTNPNKPLPESSHHLPASIELNASPSPTQPDKPTPTCPSCGIKMVLKTVYKGNNSGKEFWGCSNYPRCKNTFKVVDN